MREGAGAYSLPSDILTAITPQEASVLVDLVRDRRVIEVGAQFGFSTVLMAQVAKEVVSIDHHRGDEHAGHFDTLGEYLGNLRRYGVRARVEPIVADWREVVHDLATFDVAFLDASHGEIEVANELSAFSRLAPTLAVHDYGRFGVKPAVDRFRHDLGWALDLTETLAVLRKP